MQGRLPGTAQPEGCQRGAMPSRAHGPGYEDHHQSRYPYDGHDPHLGFQGRAHRPIYENEDRQTGDQHAYPLAYIRGFPWNA